MVFVFSSIISIDRAIKEVSCPNLRVGSEVIVVAIPTTMGIHAIFRDFCFSSFGTVIIDWNTRTENRL